MFQIGSYVEYNNGKETKTGMVVEIQQQLVKVLFSDGKKYMIKASNLKLSGISAAIKCSYGGIDYLVTPKENIISLASQSIMNWPYNHGSRVAILKLVNKDK